MNINGFSADLAQATMVLLKEYLCVKPAETIVITADVNTDVLLIKSIQAISHLLGAKAVCVSIDPALPLQGLLADKYIPEPVALAVNCADVWIDLCMPYMAGSSIFDKAMRNGKTRYFLGADITVDALIRIFAKVGLDELFKVTDLFDHIVQSSAGKEFRITSPAGTDVTFQTISIPSDSHIGIAKATRPGGFFVPGTVGILPVLDSVKGQIVCEALFHEYYIDLPEPMIFEIDGRIKKVTGGGTEWPVMERALRRAGGGDYGSIVHFSCGHHPAARYTGKCFTEDQRVIGCNAIGFGFPPGMPGGGENHPDGIVKDQSIWIDGVKIVHEGKIVATEDLVKALSELEIIY